jgi:hypothetical protein
MFTTSSKWRRRNNNQPLQQANLIHTDIWKGPRLPPNLENTRHRSGVTLRLGTSRPGVEGVVISQTATGKLLR